MNLRLRTRLMLGLALPIIITGAISAVVGTKMIGRSLSSQAQHNLKLDINSARLIYRNSLDAVHDEVHLATLDPVIHAQIAAGASEAAASQLEHIRRQTSLDVLDLLDTAGRVLARARTPSHHGDSLANDPVIQAAMAGRDAPASAALATSDELRAEAVELAMRARTPIVPTPSTTTATEDRGMLLKAAVVVRDQNSRPMAILYGARLISHDDPIVMQIHQTIFKGESYEGKPVGEATICLGDLRIATTATTQTGALAIGTSIAPEVGERVLVVGEPWVGLASVGGSQHITSYEPIRDGSGRIIGALALGILEQKFTDIRRDALIVFLAINAAGLLVGLLLAGFMTSKVSKPMRRLVQAVQQVASGNLDQQVDPDTSVVEIAKLGTHINSMASALKQRDLAIKRQTEEKISRSERLAIVGRLAAGVAHQINNPLGGIMLFSNLLLRKFPEAGIEHDNLERIANEAKRCQHIVQGLLDFARNREPKLERTQINNPIDKALQLVENQALFLNVKIERRYADNLPLVEVDVAQMQEVFLNLILNAVEAMNNTGKLTLTTESSEQGQGVQISIADTGCGIDEDQIERIFEPFFTTKEVGKGTGLGLSISRGIVETHGGNIWAKSERGQGTTFFIRLPAASEHGKKGDA